MTPDQIVKSILQDAQEGGLSKEASIVDRILAATQQPQDHQVKLAEHFTALLSADLSEQDEEHPEG